MKTRFVRSSKTNLFWKTIKLATILILSTTISAQATVNITRATGGTNISADNAANSNNPIGGTFSALGTITIARNQNGDFTSGTNVTFILSAPALWTFNTGAAVTAGRGGGVTSASAVVTDATTITITSHL